MACCPKSLSEKELSNEIVEFGIVVDFCLVRFDDGMKKLPPRIAK